MKKLIFYLLGLLATLFLTPPLAYLLTSGVPSFEGGRAYAFLFLMPFLFVLLVIFFIVEQFFFKTRVSNYHKKRNIVSIVIIVAIAVGYGVLYVQDLQEQKELQRNAYKCKQEVAKEFEGFVAEIGDAHKRVVIRKSDSSRSVQTYYFNTSQEAFQYGYVGQLVRKKADSEILIFTDRNYKDWKVLIPCYQ